MGDDGDGSAGDAEPRPGRGEPADAAPEYPPLVRTPRSGRRGAAKPVRCVLGSSAADRWRAAVWLMLVPTLAAGAVLGLLLLGHAWEVPAARRFGDALRFYGGSLPGRLTLCMAVCAAPGAAAGTAWLCCRGGPAAGRLAAYAVGCWLWLTGCGVAVFLALEELL